MRDDNRIKKVGFADESLRKAYDSLKEGRFEDRQTYEYLGKAFDELEKNPYAGIKVPGSVWPKIYIRKYGIDNLRKYDMPNGWPVAWLEYMPSETHCFRGNAGFRWRLKDGFPLPGRPPLSFPGFPPDNPPSG